MGLVLVLVLEPELAVPLVPELAVPLVPESAVPLVPVLEEPLPSLPPVELRLLPILALSKPINQSIKSDYRLETRLRLITDNLNVQNQKNKGTEEQKHGLSKKGKRLAETTTFTLSLCT